MGAMNFLNHILNNGDAGRDCEVEKWCHRPAYQLSSSDKKLGTSLTNIQPYKRTIRYECANGHKFEKTFTIKKDLLKEEIR
jgi:hypothetical protein